jgi:hypothetical protein
MDKNKKASLHHFPGSRNDINNRLSLGDVLIVSGDEAWAISMEKILNDNLYGASVASNGDQIIERLKKPGATLL